MIKNRKANVPAVFLVIAFIILVSYVGGGDAKNIDFQDNKEIKEITLEDCQDQTLESTAHCLQDYMATFYKYVVRSDIKRTEEDIRQNGGDCWDYTLLYEDWARDLGFRVERVRLSSNYETDHVFTIIYDEKNNNDYCVLDQLTEIKCVSLD